MSQILACVQWQANVNLVQCSHYVNLVQCSHYYNYVILFTVELNCVLITFSYEALFAFSEINNCFFFLFAWFSMYILLILSQHSKSYMNKTLMILFSRITHQKSNQFHFVLLSPSCRPLFPCSTLDACLSYQSRTSLCHPSNEFHGFWIRYRLSWFIFSFRCSTFFSIFFFSSFNLL